MNKKLVLLAVLASSLAHATHVGTSTTRLASVSTYNHYGNGDVMFKVENPVPECVDGYWLAKGDSGYQVNVAMIVAALQAKSSIVVFGLPDQRWSGSNGLYCKLYLFEAR